jgi:hypothetical protein
MIVTMRTQFRRLAALLAFVALSAADSAWAADEVRFRLVNGTDYPIRAVVLSAANLESWGPNALAPPSIKPGDAREIIVRGVFVDCNVDLKVAFDNDASEPVWRYLNICELQRIRLRFDKMSGVSTASYEE